MPQTNVLFDNERSGAQFSTDRNYRYALWRLWGVDTRHYVMFIGLNPSTANEISDDPTIRRVKSMVRNWGYDGFYMLNLFAWVTAYPDELKKCPDPVGENNVWLQKIGKLAKKVVFAWGNFPEAQERAKQVIKMFPDAYALHINKNGSPKHPLYCKSDIQLIPFIK